MVLVRIPSPLQRVSGAGGVVEVSSGTLDNVLAEVCDAYEPLRVHLYHGNGKRRGHIFIAVNGSKADPETMVNDGDVVDLLLATAGGSLE